MTGDRRRLLLDTATTAAIILTCVVVTAVNWNKLFPPGPPVVAIPQQPILLDRAASQGNPNAKVVLVMYTDYQCPFCARFDRGVLPSLIRDYVSSGRVLLVVKHNPLRQIHPLAFSAAVAATCADRQGKFWELHQRLVENGNDLSVERLTQLAGAVSLDMMTFADCQAGSEAAKQVITEASDAASIGLSGTPAFLLGRATGNKSVRVSHVILGVRSVDEFRRRLDELLGL